MKYLFFLLLVIFPFGQLGRLPFGESEVALQINDLIAGLLVGAWIIWHLVRRKKITPLPLLKPILVFLGIALFSILVNLPEWKSLAGVLYLLRWVAYSCLYFFLCEAFSGKEISRRETFRVLALAGMVVGFLGIFQYFLYPDLRNLYYLGWDPHYFRVFSTFFDPAFTGVILVLTLILLVVSFWEKRPKGIVKWWFLVAIIVVYSAFALTYSRGSYLAFLAGIGTIAYLKRAPKFFVVTVLIFVITLVVLPKREDRIGSNLAREDTITARIINWKQSLEVIRDHPIIGVGFNNYRLARKQYGFTVENGTVSHASAGADSSLLFVWATTGIFGLLAYLWLGWRMTKLALRSWRIEKSVYGLALLSGIAALFFHSFFVNSLFYPWTMEWIWILAAIVSVSKTNKVRPSIR
ncbi:MAG: O-antigen ligase family protein [bacterium]|nr:O-antigen ligase family protein [bacterium]